MKTIRSQGAAVLVIDVQRGLFFTNPPPEDANLVVENINRVTTKARRAGVPVVFIQHQGPPGSGDLEQGSQAWELHPQLQVEALDLSITKTTCDVFYRTTLPGLLKSKGIHTLVMAGYATDFCLDASVRNAASLEFELVIPADAHTTNPGGGLTARQIRDHHNYAWQECISCKPVRVVPAAEIDFG